ncbi:MAG: hypothetical protein A2V67_02545 [Deltaproteobacteria bacterium RBG_13_61_14]|nr:MAG: hypothetical protein A2V67_02545 [Deltaproteobacteria bacterium RBG_13_61_14]
MKIIVFGGAGDMGSKAVEELAASEEVRLVTIADRNMTGAERLRLRLAGSPALVDVKGVDADRHPNLVEAMRGYDVAASALGPFHRYEMRLVAAAVEAGVHYASICDEWEAAEAVINAFHEKAREKELFILTGLGTSPGISNVGVRYLAERMDRPRRADISVFQPLNAGGGPAVVRHMLYIMSGEVAAWRGGRRVMVRACSEERVIEFPRYGAMKVWNMGHSEPETVPRFIPGMEEVNFFMGFGPGSLWVVKPAQWGLFNSAGRRELIARGIDWLEQKTRGGEPDWGAVRVDVWGESQGQEAHGLLCGIGQMREATGISLAIGTLMLARKQLLVEEGGVYAPEACLEPQAFIRHFKSKGIVAYGDLEMKKPLE